MADTLIKKGQSLYYFQKDSGLELDFLIRYKGECVPVEVKAKTADQKKEEYKEAISLLKKGYAIRDVAKLTGKAISTIQRVKKEFC